MPQPLEPAHEGEPPEAAHPRWDSKKNIILRKASPLLAGARVGRPQWVQDLLTNEKSVTSP